MRKLHLLLLLFPFFSLAQNVPVTPTITPALFRYNDQITVVYDVTGTSLANLTTAYAWVWIPGKSIDAKYNINPASNNATATNNAKFTKSTPSGKTLFTLTFRPSDFFSQNISAETQMGILLKGNDWSNGQTTDYIATIWDGSFQVKLTSPSTPLFVTNGQVINITAETPIDANFELYVNNVLTNTSASPSKNYSYQHTVTETSGYVPVRLVATQGTSSDDVVFQYLFGANSPSVSRPTGIIPGINYNTSDATKVTLCLLAPGKTSAYVRGDFSNWEILGQNLMNKDGEFFWIELTGLTSGLEYGYQYLIDKTLYLADPYADKTMDQDDQFIPASTYPGLKPFPQAAISASWYFNRLSVFQTNQQPYVWQAPAFVKPAKEKLVVYELLLRDFFEDEKNNYQTLTDSIGYFKRMGVNAIELMPIMEFGGNNSWGYNPQFMFAPDKAYGPKNKLKQFVDVCHQNGIAVILDIALNHQDTPNPYLLMDFNFTTFKPNPTNKWFNVEATHPFSVFFDMNHESPYTKDYLDTINYYWLKEYKVDGFRFDLSKGFTQVNNPTNVTAWSNYDASRVAILERMADKIWEHFPDAYVILEHLAVNAEEKVLAEYRANEGKGMMLWGNLNYAYAQNSMGYASGSAINWIHHTVRGWTVPHVVGYMESHDEERMMFRNMNYGNSGSGYSIKTFSTALDRIKAAATVFYTIPGPKMLWQFGEVAYDYSINFCQDDGTISDNCRTYPKPVVWDYHEDYERSKLNRHVSDLLRLRNTYDVFTNGTAVVTAGDDLVKQVSLKNNPYTGSPANAGEMNAVAVVNFDLIPRDVFVDFPHTGTWYDYYRYGVPMVANVTPYMVRIPAGGFKIFTDVEITNPVISGVDDESDDPLIALYPNPSQNTITIQANVEVLELGLITLQGGRMFPAQVSENTWDVSVLNPGIYVAEIRTRSGMMYLKVIKK